MQADGTWIATGDFSAANSGENLVTAQVDDEAGNPGEASANVFVDRGFSAQQLSDGPNGQQGGGQRRAVSGSWTAAGDKLVFTGLNFNLMSTATGSSGAQVYVKDLTTGAITFVAPDPSENAEFASISPDGRYVEFVSNANLDPIDIPDHGNPPLYFHLHGRSHHQLDLFPITHDDAYDGTDPDTLDPGVFPAITMTLGITRTEHPIAPLPVFPLAIADGGNCLGTDGRSSEPDQVVHAAGYDHADHGGSTSSVDGTPYGYPTTDIYLLAAGNFPRPAMASAGWSFCRCKYTPRRYLRTARSWRSKRVSFPRQ